MLLHVLAAASAALTRMPAALIVAAMALIGASLLRESHRLSRRGGWLCYAASEGWSLERLGETTISLDIQGSSVMTPWIVFVHARAGGSEYAWALLAPPGDPDGFRHLRLCLRVAGIRKEFPERPDPLSSGDG